MPALQKSLSPRTMPFYMHSMMQIGLAHVQPDHRYVNTWVLKIVSNLHDASVFSEYRSWIVLLKVMQFFHLGNHQEPTSDDGDKWLKELELLQRHTRIGNQRTFNFGAKKGFAPTANRKSNRKSKKKGKAQQEFQ